MRNGVLPIGLAFVFTFALGGACAASKGNNAASEASSGNGGGASGGASSGSGATSTTSTASGKGGSISSSSATGSGGSGGGDACAKFTAAATQAPAALMFILDRSASMSTNGKWQAAQQAIAAVLDADAFDTMSLGLMAFPASYVPTPQCLCNECLGDCTCFGELANGVACGYPGLAQVPLDLAGTQKSTDTMGVRHEIYQWLVSNSPETADPSDASPIYETMNSGYQTLAAYTNVSKRLMILITDGGFSCTSVAQTDMSQRQSEAIMDANMCPDWESPDAVNAMIKQWHDDPNTPTSTFIIGVPGSDSTGGMQGPYDTAPYHMKLALSTYAVSGSPETIDPSCDSTLMWTQSGADPMKPCHFDLTGSNFNAMALEQAVSQIRGEALGCTYDLPPPPMGQTIDPSLVNVKETTNGMTVTIPKRSSMSDMCAATPGCWDYNAMMQVELIGAACMNVEDMVNVSVDVEVGCKTVLK